MTGTAAQIRDTIGGKVANLPSMSGHTVYGNGSAGIAGVAEWGGVIGDDFPVAVVARGDTDATTGTGIELYTRLFLVTFYVSSIDPGAAHQWVDQLEEELRNEFRHGIQLGGLVSSCLFKGSRAPFRFTDQDRLLYAWQARIQTEEKPPQDYTA